MARTKKTVRSLSGKRLKANNARRQLKSSDGGKLIKVYFMSVIMDIWKRFQIGGSVILVW